MPRDYQFIHIPKTGGLSIRHALEIRADRPVHRFARHYGESYVRGRFSFAIVRNPWDRVLSFACMKGRGRWSRQQWDRVAGFLNTQVDYVADRNGDVMVDYVGRFENLEADFDTICKKIGIDTPTLPHLNASEHYHYRRYYDDEMMQIVAHRYAEEIKMFDYHF